MKRTKKSFLRKIAYDLDFPSDIYFGGFRVEMYSDREAVIYGIKSIVDYTSEKIELLYKNGKIVFSGCCLSCNSYVEGVVCVYGNIESMCIDRR